VSGLNASDTGSRAPCRESELKPVPCVGSTGAGASPWLPCTAHSPSTGHARGWLAPLPSHARSPCAGEGEPQAVAALRQKGELKCTAAFLFALWWTCHHFNLCPGAGRLVRNSLGAQTLLQAAGSAQWAALWVGWWHITASYIPAPPHLPSGLSWGHQWVCDRGMGRGAGNGHRK